MQVGSVTAPLYVRIVYLNLSKRVECVTPSIHCSVFSDIWQVGDELATTSTKFRPCSLSSSRPESSPGRITRRETNSIFDELILQLNEVSEELDHPLSPSPGRHSSSTTPSSPEKVSYSDAVEPRETVETRERADKNHLPTSALNEQSDGVFSSLPRPKHDRSPISGSVGLSSSTLPKKSGKWMQRVGSPLLKSRKSFTSGLATSKHRGCKDESMEIREDATNEQEGEGLSPAEGVAKKIKGTRRIFSRKRSLPDVHNYNTISTLATTPTLQRTSSSDNFPINEEPGVTSFDHQPSQLPKRIPLLSPPVIPRPPTPPSRSVSRQGDPVTNSLEQMVTLSRNKECLSTLVSYICMPKCESRSVREQPCGPTYTNL